MQTNSGLIFEHELLLFSILDPGLLFENRLLFEHGVLIEQIRSIV